MTNRPERVRRAISVASLDPVFMLQVWTMVMVGLLLAMDLLLAKAARTEAQNK